MEAKIQKQIVDYFSFFEEFYHTSKTSLKDSQKSAISINKLIVRCGLIKNAVIIGTPFEKFDDIQSKLSARIHNLITEEIQEIRGHLSKLEDLFAKLCHKQKNLTDCCIDINFSEQTSLVKGTPLQPPLRQLLQFTEDTITFAGTICAQIENSLNVLAFKGLHTKSLVDNFKIPSAWQHRVLEIIAYTSFCSENQI